MKGVPLKQIVVRGHLRPGKRAQCVLHQQVLFLSFLLLLFRLLLLLLFWYLLLFLLLLLLLLLLMLVLLLLLLLPLMLQFLLLLLYSELCSYVHSTCLFLLRTCVHGKRTLMEAVKHI